MNTIFTSIIASCPFCGGRTKVRVPAEKYALWMSGQQLIQEVFPEMSLTERETLISGLCSDCQEKFFSAPEEDE